MPATRAVLAAVLAVLLAGVLLPGGCGWVEWPPPAAKPSAVNPPARPTSASRGPESDRLFVGATQVTVGKGDSVYGLARRHRVSMRAIIDANRLRPPYLLRPGQRLALPRARTHVVKGGETLYGISRVYGVDTYALARANGLGPPYTIRVGQGLRVPGAAAPVESARRTPSSAGRPPAGRPPAVSRKSARPAPVAEPPRRTGQGFIWPVRGKLLSTFGPKAKGLHNDGINIAAPRGTPVRAVEGGVVAYAGNELRGFGNLLLIKHDGGWITAYAHNETLAVKPGDRVKRGQVIARVGSTGSVSTPQLHFELRRGKRAIDPERHLVAGRV